MKTSLLLHTLIEVATLSTISRIAPGDTFGAGASSFDIEFVTIGNPGNAADLTGQPNPVGAVSYATGLANSKCRKQ